MGSRQYRDLFSRTVPAVNPSQRNVAHSMP